MLKVSTKLAVIFLGLFASTAFPASLQDWEFNINGTDYYPSGGASFASIPGLVVTTNATSTTYTVTFNPGAAGNYYVGAFFYDPAGVPFYNESGLANGSAASGQQWQIDVPEYDVNSANHPSPTILDNLANGALDDTNHVPGGGNNYLNNCVGATCNDFVSLATGYHFTLGANQEEQVSFVVSSTNPGGFSVEDIHPVDGSNTTAADVFLSATAATVNTGGGGTPGTPEPSTFGLFGMASGVIGFMLMRRRNAGRNS